MTIRAHLWRTHCCDAFRLRLIAKDLNVFVVMFRYKNNAQCVRPRVTLYLSCKISVNIIDLVSSYSRLYWYTRVYVTRVRRMYRYQIFVLCFTVVIDNYI